MPTLAARAVCAAVLAVATAAAHAAPSILLLTGGGASTVSAPLTAAGFNVINGTLGPGQLASGLLDPTVVGVYIWSDHFGNTSSAADPLKDFNAADHTALTTFAATHKSLILDGLSWRLNGNTDEQNFSKNEALALSNAGGGVVLGADDASGALIVQHVNQVAGWLGLNLFTGVYNTSPANQVFGGLLLNTPNAVNPANVVGTTTYSEIPNGTQPNGQFLSTAVFGFDSGTNHCCEDPIVGSGPVADLHDATFNGVLYHHVNHVVTTNIVGAGIDPPPPSVPAPAALYTLGLAMVGVLRRRRARA